MKNKIGDLRNHLFETIEALKDESKPMDLARARTISDVAKTIIESAQVEVDMVKATGAITVSEFFPEEKEIGPVKKALTNGAAARN